MKTQPKIILVGAGGHCKSVIDVIESQNKFEIFGILDVPHKIGTSVFNYQIIGDDDQIELLNSKNFYFFITLGFIKTATIRQNLFQRITNANQKIPVIISPYSVVSKYSEIKRGTVIMHQSLINADTSVGENCIINSHALIEHDCNIGNNCHISTNATVNGGCTIEDNCFIGSGAVLKNGIAICANTIVGAGAIVTKNITQSGVYIGNPAKFLKQI